jgi:uncharacterized protein (TIGR01777 family)
LDEPVVLTRNPDRAKAKLGDVSTYPWDPQKAPPPRESLEGVEAVFHLAGESIGEGRWTEAKKQRIRNSRIIGTRHLVEALATMIHDPPVLVSGSAIGFYGSRGDQILDETTTAGDDFLADVCKEWEDEARKAEDTGVRTVFSRTGIVLETGGGALAKMLPLFRLGLGGRLGSGHQWMSWIHLDDLVGQLLHAARSPRIRGPMNAVAPHPVTNREFTRVLAGVLRRPAWFPAPAFALRLAIGEFAEALLGSQRVVPRVALDSGYEFQYSELDGALRNILS